MNPLFIVLPVGIELDLSSNRYVNIFKLEEKSTIEDIEKEYLSFRTEVMGLDEDIHGEIVFICIRDVLAGIEKPTAFINKFFLKLKTLRDINHLVFVDILNSLDEDFPISALQMSSRVLDKIKIRYSCFLFTRRNINNRVVDEDEMYLQVKDLVKLIQNQHRLITTYSRTGNKNKHIYNAIGSAQISFPDKEVEESVLQLSYSSQLYYLLLNQRFTKEEYANISSKIPSLDDQIKVDRMLEKEYSQKPNILDVVDSVNALYDNADIENVTGTFDQIDLFPFANYVSKEAAYSAERIEAVHHGYMLNVINRTEDAHNKTDLFFQLGEDLFRNYRNDEIVKIQKNLNNQKKAKTRAIIDEVDSYSDETIVDSKSFSDTTSFEALIESLSYFAIGSYENEVKHDKNLKERISKITGDSSNELAVNRRKLFKKFHDRNNAIKEGVKYIDDELESNLEDEGSKGFRSLIEQRLQLSFSVANREAGVFKKERYSYLQKCSVLSTIAAIVLFLVVFYILKAAGVEKLFRYSMIAAAIPLLVGSVLILKRVLIYKRLRKYLEGRITDKTKLLREAISNHDSFVKEYINQVKIEYTLEILRDIQKYCRVQVYKLNNFRKYLLNHYLLSIKKYNAISFEKSIFNNSLLSKRQFEDHFFIHEISSYFEKKRKERISYYKLYLDHCKAEISYDFSPSKLKINFFDENETAYDRVDPLDQHISVADYHNDFDKEPVLFMSDEEHTEPVIINDINQGQVGNCYYMATIGAFALSNPSFIRKMITSFDLSDDIAEDEKDSTEQSFLVRFYDDERKERFVAVDNKFWFQKDTLTPIYADFGYKNEENYEIWPMILEKAWAKVNDGYNWIVGSNESAKFSKKQRKLDFGLALSGNYIKYSDLSELGTEEEIISILDRNLKDEVPMVIYSKNSTDEGIIDFHAYTVSGVEGKKVSLYNPHGTDHVEGKPIRYILDNFDTLLCFTLEDPAELVISPQETVKYVEHVEEIEKILKDYLGKTLLKRIKKIPREDLINDELFKDVIKNIDKYSVPLVNNIKERALKESSILFTDYSIDNMSILRSNPNEIKSRIEPDIYLQLTKIISWEF